MFNRKVKKIKALSTLLLTGCLIASCGKSEQVEKSSPQASQIHINANYLNKTIGCDDEFSIAKQSWKLQTLRFFIADLQGKRKNGEWQTLPFKTTSRQTHDIALLGIDCQFGTENNEGSESPWQITFEQAVDFGDFTELSFNLGVNFEQNHLNPLSQPAPLNESSMFWVWRTGHKFLRLEMAASRSTNDKSSISTPISQPDHWVYHLGSVGCSSASTMRAPKEPCRYLNLARIVMPLSNESVTADKVNQRQINFNLAALLSGFTPSSQNHCQSEPDSKDCQILWKNINHLNGEALFSDAK